MPPDDELADEVPLRDDEYEAPPEAAPNPSDSSVDFAPEGAGASAEQLDDEYAGPVEDLSDQLADDAGDQASYGYDSASETARFDRTDIEPSLLSDSSSAPDESDKYRLSQSDPAVAEPTSFADDAGATPSDDATYEPAAADVGGEEDSYASHHPDLDTPSSDETSPVEEEAPVAFTIEEEEPAPPPRVVAAPAAKKPAAAVDNEPRPGQVRKSAIDEMFQRAADLKRRKGS